MSLAHQDLRERDLSKMLLRGADLSRTNLSGVNLASKDLSMANLVGANLTKANLTNAILDHTDLSRATLLGANLLGAKLSATKLRRAKLSGCLLDPDALDHADTYGAALPTNSAALVTVSSSLQFATSMTWNEEGDLMFMGEHSGLISIWDVEARRRIRSWQAHSDSNGLVRVAYSGQGRLLASCRGGPTVKFWDISNAAQLKSLSAVSLSACRLTFSPTELLLAISGTHGTIELWDVATLSCLAVRSTHEAAVESMAFSSDGRMLATGDREGLIQIWEIPSGNLLRTLQRKHKVDSFMFSPDGKSLVSTSCGFPMQAWNLESGREFSMLDLATAHCVASASDGKTFATGGEHGISLWDPAGVHIRKLAEKPACCISELAFAPTGKKLAGNTGFVTLWNLEGCPQSSYLSESLGGFGVRNLAVSSTTLAVAGRNSVSRWDFQRGTEVSRTPEIEAIEHVAFSADLTQFATLNHNHLSFRAWDKRPIHEWNLVNFSGCCCLGFDQQARFLACGGNGGVLLYDLSRRGETTLLRDRRRQAVLSLAFDPTGGLLAHGGSDGRIAFWNLHTLNRPKSRKEHAREVTALAFSVDGARLASGGADAMKLFDTATGQLVRVFEGHTQAISRIAFSPSGRNIVSAAGCDSIRLWDLETGQLLLTIPVTSSIMGLAYDPLGKHLIAALGDDTIQVFAVETGASTVVMKPTPGGWVMFDSKGRYRFSGNVAGHFWHTIGLCRFEPGELDEFLPELQLPPSKALF